MRPQPCALLLAGLLLSAGCRKNDELSTKSADALRAYQQGVSLYEKFYYTEAKTSFLEALRHDSTFAMVWLRLAMVNSVSGNEPDAQASIARAREFMGSATRREQMYIRLITHRLDYDYTAAAQTADSIIMEFPKDREAYFIRGSLFDWSKNYDAAIRMYEKSVDVDTGFALGWMMLGYAYSAVGESEKALGYMERYIRLAPGVADSRASYADLLMRYGRYEEAYEQYKQSLSLKSDYWYAVHQIGEVYVVEGRLKEAAQQWEQGYKLMIPSKKIDASRVAARGRLELERGNYTGAVVEAREALRIDSVNWSAAYVLAEALAKKKEWSDAEAVINRIEAEFERMGLLQSPQMVDLYLLKGGLFLEKGDLDEAETEFQNALDFASVFARAAAFQGLGEVYLKRKDYQSAIGVIEEALQVNPHYPRALFTLTKVYNAMGDRAMTSEIGESLMKLWKGADPDFLRAVELRKLLGSKGQIARVTYRKTRPPDTLHHTAPPASLG